MTPAASAVMAPPPAVATEVDQSAAIPGPGGDWPHTSRVLPWLVALFLFMAFLVPFDSVKLPVHLPADAKLDRFVLGLLVLVFIVVWATSPRRTGPLRRATAIDGAVLLFTIVAATTVVMNFHRLAMLGDLNTSVKKLALLVSYVTFFYIVKRTIRPSELRAYAKLYLGLACALALGTIYQYRTNANLFFSWTTSVLRPFGFTVSAPPPNPKFGRAVVAGPTLHPLDIVTMLSLALPFAVMQLVDAKRTKTRLIYAAITALIFAGTAATNRKSALIVPFATVIVLMIYRRRQAVKLLPICIVILALIKVLAPGAVGSIVGQLAPGRVSTDPSTTGRESDYNAASAYIRDSLVFGRGYGSFDPPKYRILDNQYLGLAVEGGAVSIAAFLALLFATIGTANRLILRRHPRRGPPALAAASGAVSLLIGSFLYDLLGYPQAPYLFFFLLAMCVVAARDAPPRRPFTAPPVVQKKRRRRKRKLQAAAQAA